MFRRHFDDRLRRITSLVVMAALLLAQTLGLVHRVVHANGATSFASAHGSAQGMGAVQAQAVTAGPADTAVAPPRGLVRLFASHDVSGCESYDHLTNSQGVWDEPAAFAARAASAATPASAPVLQIAAQAAGGPPNPI